MTKSLDLLSRIGRKLTEAGVFWLALLSPAYAQVPSSLEEGVAGSRPTDAPDTLFGEGGIFQRVVNTILFVIGAIAVLMLIIGGIRYVTSAGNQDAVTGAKNTIMYAIVGLLIAIIAFAAVNFIVQQLGG